MPPVALLPAIVLPVAAVVPPVAVVVPPVDVLHLDVLKPPVVVSPVPVVMPRVAIIVSRRRAARCRLCIAVLSGRASFRYSTLASEEKASEK